MKSLFQRVSGGEPKLTLAVFGKHPGWDDHIPGIGLETDILAGVKQVLYVAGIGGQIDSGAWEKMEPERRLEGYDHSFLWLREGHAIYGQFWSSTDGKGRSKYPMVTCVDGQGVTPNFMLGSLPTGLDRLREACKAATSAEKVVSDCRTAQEQLRGLVAQNPLRPSDTEFIRQAHHRFLGHSDLGPDRLGFLRALHELQSAPGYSTTGRPVGAKAGGPRSRHLRVPLGADSREDALGLWGGFLRCAVPEPTPILLMCRNGVEWLDVIIGDPRTDDFFCLQASPKAVPLVTEIPYHLSPELKPKLQDLESRFAGTENTPRAPAPSASQRPDPAPASGTPVPETEPKRGLWKLFGVIVLLAAVGAGALVFRARHGPSLAQAPTAPETAPAPAKSPPPVPEQSRAPTDTAGTIDPRADQAAAQAQVAFDAKDYSKALSLAGDALRLDPKHVAATQIKDQAQSALVQAAAVADLEKRFNQALTAAQEAFLARNYATALARAEAALKLKPQDVFAATLHKDAQTALAESTRTAALDRDFAAALAASEAALKTRDFSNALTRLQEALRLKPQDPAALKLKTTIETAQTEAAVAGRLAAMEKLYAEALAAATNSLAADNYDEAERRAKTALEARPNDPTALALLGQLQAARRKQQLTAVPPPPARTSDTAPSDRKNYTDALGLDFVWIPGLGPNGAYVGKFEVTQRQFRSVTGKVPPLQPATDDELPVANISFEEAKEFCEALSRKHGKRYSLPTRDEFLALVGVPPDEVTNAWALLTSKNDLAVEVTSWRVSPSLKQPARGGSRGTRANGLADVLGNVREWLADGQSAGFSYDTEGVGRRKSLLYNGKDLDFVTGLRCVLRDPP